MTAFLLFTLAVLGLLILAQGFWRRDRQIQYPFLASAVFLGWMFPQLLGLSNHAWLPPSALDKTIFMAILCLAAIWVGDSINRQPARLFDWAYDRGRLMGGAYGLMIFGALFFYQVTLLAADAGTRWTGAITIYSFFAQALSFGFALALVLFARKATWPSLIAVCFGLAFYLDRIVVHGRRAAMAELVVMLLMVLWFNRRWQPSRTLMVGALLLGALVINSIGDYRQTMLGDDHLQGTYGWSGAGISELMKIDFVGNLRGIALGESNNFELTNAALIIEAADRSLHFDYGLSHWNGFVGQYIPGQWIGHDNKAALMVSLDNSVRNYFDHTAHTGTTLTGLSDAFQSFWYFGAIKFILIALIVSRWYRAAMQNNLAGQLVMILSITPALHAITHSTHSFFVIFLQLLVFVLPVLLLARTRRPNVQPRLSPALSRTAIMNHLNLKKN